MMEVRITNFSFVTSTRTISVTYSLHEGDRIVRSNLRKTITTNEDIMVSVEAISQYIVESISESLPQ